MSLLKDEEEREMGMKNNVFGSIYKTEGQNLMEAIEGCEQPVGIPPYDYDKMLEIMRAALKPEEYDLLCRGFGIGGARRLKRRNIAKLYMVSEREITRMAHEAIAKLQEPPYKMLLCNLTPPVTYLFDQIAILRQQVASLKNQLAKAKPEENG